jgi:hypothetical protein
MTAKASCRDAGGRNIRCRFPLTRETTRGRRGLTWADRQPYGDVRLALRCWLNAVTSPKSEARRNDRLADHPGHTQTRLPPIHERQEIPDPGETAIPTRG